MSLYSLLEAAVLFLNALAILHEERFLNKGLWCIVLCCVVFWYFYFFCLGSYPLKLALLYTWVGPTFFSYCCYYLFVSIFFCSNIWFPLLWHVTAAVHIKPQTRFAA
jgi:hypothetical protein